MGCVLEHTLSEEERSQILQTIDMFEVITQTQPDDYQSLEILKDAYKKVGKPDESLRVTRRLAEAYFSVGSYSHAMKECEAVLVAEPNAPEILALLGEIETRLQQSAPTAAETSPQGALLPRSEQSTNGAADVVSVDSSLLEIGGRNPGQVRKRVSLNDTEMGNEQLAKFLIVQQMFPEEQVNAALEEVKLINKAALTGQVLAGSMLEKLCNADEEKLDRVLSALIDRTKFAYVPLEYYDIDRQVVRMLPDDLTISRLFVPFDLVSRTIMVAVSNPFDAAAREAVQQSLDYTVAWYLARPAAIVKILQDIYRLEPRT